MKGICMKKSKQPTQSAEAWVGMPDFKKKFKGH